jgi:phosphoserine phosphatase
MQYALLLMAARSTKALSHEIAGRIAALNGVRAPAGWLEDKVACEFSVELADHSMRQALQSAAMEAVGSAPIDVALVPAHNRRKKLFLADMDSTIIGQECIDELGAMTGLGDQISDITTRAMRGDLDFAEALRERVTLMKGLDAGYIDRVVAERITYNNGGRDAVQTMVKHGTLTVLVSGGFEEFAAHVAAHTGFDHHHGNRLIIADGHLAGTVAEPILGRSAKLDTLHRYCSEISAKPEDVIAVGDGANDLDMLQAAGMGVAFHAKPIVAEAAEISIRFADLTALLFLQGYKAADICRQRAPNQNGRR